MGMVLTGKHAYHVECGCERCIKERRRRDVESMKRKLDNTEAAKLGHANRAARKRSRDDLVERYRRMDDAGILDRGEYDDLDW